MSPLRTSLPLNQQKCRYRVGVGCKTCPKSSRHGLCWTIGCNQLQLVGGSAAARQSAAVGWGVCCSTTISCSWLGGLLQHDNQLQLVGGSAAARQSAAVGWGVCCSTTISCSWLGGLLQHDNQLQLVGGSAAARQSAAVGWGSAAARQSAAVGWGVCSWLGGLLQHGNQLQLVSVLLQQQGIILRLVWVLLQHDNQLQLVGGSRMVFVHH